GLPPKVVLGLRRATIDSACSAAALVLLAPDLRQELPVLFLRLREAVIERGLPVIEISPVATAMSPLAEVLLLHRPGEAGLVARALMAESDPGSEVGGVGAEAIIRARRLLSGAASRGEPGSTGSDSPAVGQSGTPGDVVVVLGRPSLAESADSVTDAAAALARGGGGGSANSPKATVSFLSALRRGNIHGALDMGLAPGLLPGRVDLQEGRQWFTQAWGSLPENSGLDAAGILAGAASGEVSTIILLGADPLSDFPDATVARAGLAGAQFVVAVDSYLNASSSQADVVLPAAMYSERAGTTTNLEGRVTRLGQKLVAAGLSRPDWVIAAELALELGADLGLETLDGIWDEIERLATAHAGVTRQVLERAASADGVLAPIPATRVQLSGRRNRGPTTDPMAVPGIGSVQHQGADFDAGSIDDVGNDVMLSGMSRPPVVVFEPGRIEVPVPAQDGYALRLVSGRHLYDRGTSVVTSESLVALVDPQRVAVNPYDLDRLGIATGGEVRVRSHRGNLLMQVHGDRSVPRGVAVVGFNLASEGASDLIDSTGLVTDVRLETP
ncbi:MAG: molybdopterin oxidoreductase family protein, partial [Acidimicrobiales bacterium]